MNTGEPGAGKLARPVRRGVVGKGPPPRDLAGGLPYFAQPVGLLGLVRALRARGCPHLLAYSGYTYEQLRRIARFRPAVGRVLEDIDVLIDGPYVQERASSAGPWTGSGNQRVVDLARTHAAGEVVPWTGRSDG